MFVGLNQRLRTPLRWFHGALTANIGESITNLPASIADINSLRIYKNGSRISPSLYTISHARGLLQASLVTGSYMGGDALIFEYLTTQAKWVGITNVPSPGDPLFTDVASLLHFDGTNGSTMYTDVIGNVWTSGGGAYISTAQQKFGTASGDFDVSSGPVFGYITTPDAAALRPGSVDFCIECQVFHSSSGGFQTLWSKGYTGAADILLQSASGTEQWILYVGGTAVITETTSGLVQNRWYFIRVRRSGTSLSIERDGTVVGTVTNSTNINNTSAWIIGANQSGTPGGGNILHGYVDEFRLTIGNARSAGTIQTAAWPDHA